ncbi:MAG: TRAP transporter small permease subunit [Spirochaetales bacterium]|mgnify:CR=1 FL=1|nr:TRAP transporter small permease subunit [Spirochaetales bacterium]
MDRFKSILDSVFKWVLRLAMVGLLVMVVVVFTNVVLRYGFKSGIRWAEEISLVIVIWFTFIAMALGVRENLHISISILPKVLGKRFFFILDVLKQLLVMFIGMVVMVNGWKLSVHGMRSRLPATQLPNMVNYAVLPIAGVFIILYAAIHLVDGVRSFRKGGEV